MPSPITTFDAALPNDVRQMVGGLLHESLRAIDDVLSEVDGYLAEVRVAAASDGDVDLAMAERIACVCHKLLEHHENYDNSQRRIVQAACR